MGDEEHLHPAGEARKPGKEARAAFYGKLLSCCACGKIYFSRHPIALFTVSAKDFYVCADCSEAMTCSRCSGKISPETALVVETNQRSLVEMLCPTCQNKVIVGSEILWRRIRRSVGATTSSYFAAISKFISRIVRVNIRPRRRRSKQ